MPKAPKTHRRNKEQAPSADSSSGWEQAVFPEKVFVGDKEDKVRYLATITHLPSKQKIFAFVFTDTDSKRRWVIHIPQGAPSKEKSETLAQFATPEANPLLWKVLEFNSTAKQLTERGGPFVEVTPRLEVVTLFNGLGFLNTEFKFVARSPSEVPLKMAEQFNATYGETVLISPTPPSELP